VQIRILENETINREKLNILMPGIGLDVGGSISFIVEEYLKARLGKKVQRLEVML
jgi:hypothetical protein